jgi:hypothetical protein
MPEISIMPEASITFEESKDVRDDEFDAVHAYFIGPKASNLPDFRANINTILDELLAARQSYYPEDQVPSQFINQTSFNPLTLSRLSSRRNTAVPQCSSRQDLIFVLPPKRLHSFLASTRHLFGHPAMKPTCVLT